LSPEELQDLELCPCPACREFGLDGLRASGLFGAMNRADHNLWVLLREAADVESRLIDGSYVTWYRTHLDNTIYLPLIEQLVRDDAPVIHLGCNQISRSRSAAEGLSG
jgi:hypothetical protein